MRVAGAAALALALAAPAAWAAPGDVVVPAHRSRDGTFIPANVAPSSGGSYMPRASRNGRVSLRPVSRSGPARRPVPMFMEARPLRP